MFPVLLLGLLGAAVWIVWISRPRVLVTIEGGRAKLVRGELPPGLLADFEAIARDCPDARGRVEVVGTRATLKVKTPGLGEGPAQRVRNVVMLRKDRM